MVQNRPASPISNYGSFPVVRGQWFSRVIQRVLGLAAKVLILYDLPPPPSLHTFWCPLCLGASYGARAAVDAPGLPRLLLQPGVVLLLPGRVRGTDRDGGRGGAKTRKPADTREEIASVESCCLQWRLGTSLFSITVLLCFLR